LYRPRRDFRDPISHVQNTSDDLIRMIYFSRVDPCNLRRIDQLSAVHRQMAKYKSHYAGSQFLHRYTLAVAKICNLNVYSNSVEAQSHLAAHPELDILRDDNHAGTIGTQLAAVLGSEVASELPQDALRVFVKNGEDRWFVTPSVVTGCALYILGAGVADFALLLGGVPILTLIDILPSKSDFIKKNPATPKIPLQKFSLSNASLKHPRSKEFDLRLLQNITSWIQRTSVPKEHVLPIIQTFIASQWISRQAAMVLVVAILVSLVLLLVEAIKRLRAQQTFREHNIPHSDKVNFFSGNMFEFVLDDHNVKEIKKRHNELGDTHGMYYGAVPWILKQILISFIASTFGKGTNLSMPTRLMSRHSKMRTDNVIENLQEIVNLVLDLIEQKIAHNHNSDEDAAPH
ncbi:hypothetical protein GZH46_01936, partial [Fragariocoptes setiger]